jgi:parvulin-like peptidyl-prolyl isomerase
MIMTSMREKTKIVLFVVLLAFVGFIFFDWGMQVGGPGGRPGVVARVNGRDLTEDAYRRMRQQVTQNFEARTGRAPEFGDFDAIDDETWLALVRESLVQEQIEKYGITISDAEILELLRTNPPEMVRAQFTDDEGNFDAAAYQSALSNPALQAQWASVESYLRAMLPADKLRNYVALNARITTGEVQERFVARNERARARYVASLPGSVELPEGTVSDSELRAWYDAHLADYARGEQAVLEYVRASKGASPADSQSAREDLADLRRQILEGADFAEVARAWSDDGSAERGGDLGFFGRGDMVPEFDQVAFSTPVGQVSDVFASPFGFHVVKVEERKKDAGKETVRARHILLRVEASNETLREASERVEDFLAAVNEDGKEWGAAAGEAGLAVERTDPFEHGAPIPGVGLLRAADRFAFASEPGAVAKEPIEDDAALWAFRLAERRPAGTAPFEDVKDRVEAAALDAKRREAARARLASALETAGGSLEEIAKAMGASVDTTGEFSRESFLPGIGRRNTFVAKAFSLAPGALSDLVESDRGYYVLQVTERIPADPALLAEQADQIKGQLLTEKRQALVTAWIEDLLASAEIVDFRSGEGVDWKPDPSIFSYARAATATGS